MLCSFPTGILQCCLKKWNVPGFVRSDCNFPVNKVQPCIYLDRVCAAVFGHMRICVYTHPC